MTKENRYRLEQYARATASEINQLYKRPSARKVAICAWLRREMEKRDGFALRVFNGTSFVFSAGYQFRENGELKVMYYTAYHTYEIKVEDYCGGCIEA